MSIAVPATAAAGPLSAEQQQAMLSAKREFQKIRTVARVAAFNGWLTAAFALLSAPFALFSISGFFVTIGLSLVAWNELRGRRLALQIDERAPRVLAWNQLGFMALIVVYCAWMLAAGLTGPSAIEAQLRETPELESVLGDFTGIEEIYRALLCLVYGLVIFFTILMQGAYAVYYFTRQRYFAEFLRGTPPWLVDLHRAL